jgi:hypothetical protein
MLASQAIYLLSHATNPICIGYFCGGFRA